MTATPDMVPVTLSLAMIAANTDAPTLGKAIESARPYVDQIVVVVDPSSLDARAVAEEHGAEVYEFTWCGDFAAARNAALDKCTGQWVMVLDSDEEVVNMDMGRLQFMAINRPAIFTITVSSDQGNGHTVNNDTPRLFPNTQQVRYFGAIHETPRDAYEKLEIVHLDAFQIAHSGYTPEAIERADKLNRNINILTEMVKDQPVNPLLRLYISQALFSSYPDAAADQLRICLHFCQMFPGDDAHSCYDQASADLMSILSGLGEFAQAVVEARVILAYREPAHPAFWVNLANCQINIGSFDAAAASAYKAKAYKNAKTQQSDTSAVTWLPDAVLAVALANMGHDEESLIVLDRALVQGPTHHLENMTVLRASLLDKLGKV